MAEALGRRGLPTHGQDDHNPAASSVTGRRSALPAPSPTRARFADPHQGTDSPGPDWQPSGHFALGARALPSSDADDRLRVTPLEASAARRAIAAPEPHRQSPRAVAHPVPLSPGTPVRLEAPGASSSPPRPDDAAELTSSARRGIPADADASVGRRRWIMIGAVTAGLVLLVGTLYVFLGGGGGTASPEQATAAGQPGTAAGTASPGTPVEPRVSPGVDETPPSPTGNPTGLQSPDPSSPASLPDASAVLDLGAAEVPVLPGWELYADEVVQDNRRLVRIKQSATDTRIQIVALSSVTGPLTDACTDLVNDHRASYSGVATSLAVSVPVASGAEGVACSFTGTRTSDEVPTRVDFTVVRRDSDAISLVFRDTIPQSVPADSPARAELVRIECAAADSFGVTISQCAATTPGQASG